MTERASKTHACLARGESTIRYLPLRAASGVIAPGQNVDALVDGTWKPARVVEAWPHDFGSVVCLEWKDERLS